MTKGVAIPTVEDVRCPGCDSLAWRRLGERVIEAPDDGSKQGFRHLFVTEDGPFDWTCETCGYGATPGGHLDHMVSKVQSPAAGRRGPLAHG